MRNPWMSKIRVLKWSPLVHLGGHTFSVGVGLSHLSCLLATVKHLSISPKLDVLVPLEHLIIKCPKWGKTPYWSMDFWDTFIWIIFITIHLRYWMHLQLLMIKLARKDSGWWRNRVRWISTCVKSAVKWWLMQLSRAICLAISTIAAIQIVSCRSGEYLYIYV